MARQKNDGRGRIGGRAKGTPNKATVTLRQWITELIDDNREQIKRDLKVLSPAERLKIFMGLLGYIMPKATAEEKNEAGSPDFYMGEIRIGFDDDDE